MPEHALSLCCMTALTCGVRLLHTNCQLLWDKKWNKLACYSCSSKVLPEVCVGYQLPISVGDKEVARLVLQHSNMCQT